MKKVGLVRPVDALLHPEARITTQVSRKLGPNAMTAEQLRREERVRELLAGMYHRDHYASAGFTHATVGQTQETIKMLRSYLPGNAMPLQDVDMPFYDHGAGTAEDEDGLSGDEMPVEEHFVYALRDIAQSRCVFYPGCYAFRSCFGRWKARWYKHTRHWRDRRRREEAAWEPLLESLADKYLSFQYPGSYENPTEPAKTYENDDPPSQEVVSTPPEDMPPPMPSISPPAEPGTVSSCSPNSSDIDIDCPSPHADAEQRQADAATCPGALESEHHPAHPTTPPYPYTVFVLDIYTLKAEVTVERDPASLSPALDLIAHGYVAKTPVRPTVAVSIATLELLYRLRQRKASFSFEAFTKVVCDYYKVSLISRDLAMKLTDCADAIPPVPTQCYCRRFRALSADPAPDRSPNACGLRVGLSGLASSQRMPCMLLQGASLVALPCPCLTSINSSRTSRLSASAGFSAWMATTA